MSVKIYVGDMRARLKEIPDDSLDGCASDPPYHLTSIVERFGDEDAAPANVKQTGVYARSARGFMGQKWDGGDIAFQPETWAEVYRVLKPGAYLVAFSGTRTYHRLATAIEAAGFVVRDLIAEIVMSETHVQRFLASLTAEQQRAFALCIDESTFGGMLNWLYGSGFPKSHDAERAIAKATCPLPGRHYAKQLPGKAKRKPGDHICEVTAESAPWSGFGTALKPGEEPICLARKPLIGSVAANVLQFGTGALNIDGGRIEGVKPQVVQGVNSNPTSFAPAQTRQLSGDPDEGRWPANVVIGDGSAEVAEIFPATGPGNVPAKRGVGGLGTAGHVGMMPEAPGPKVGGTADRFFYTAKPDAAERHDGCRDLANSQNPHPTVKPIDLMHHLVSLIIPPGGTVLDPFLGSGSTAIAALHAQMSCVGIELDPSYVAVAERRIRHHAGLFADVEVIPAPLPEDDAEQPSAAAGAS